MEIQPELHDELAVWKARARFAEPEDLVFPTRAGRPQNRNNVRRRVLLRAAERANERIVDRGGGSPLPDGLSPHALRRSFASWLIAEGEDPAYVMQQLGHTDPKMTLGLYAKALRSKRRRPHARRHEDGSDWARLGANGREALAPHAEVTEPENEETAQERGLLEMGAGGFEPPTSRV
ncbi:MAG TPA: site-specific integrase [Thermoleophilaceae bacterium]|nr:site-specific integrase [Thermoleophilaceae bacterium]